MDQQLVLVSGAAVETSRPEKKIASRRYSGFLASIEALILTPALRHISLDPRRESGKRRPDQRM